MSKTYQLSFRIFFDGTGNDGYNAESTQLEIDNRSYHQSPTNIFRLYNNAKYVAEQANHTAQKEKFLTVYVGGIGTSSFDKDSTLDGALGNITRRKGAEGKMNHAIQQIGQELNYFIKYQMDDGDSISSLNFDIFGFSRGAALARIFSKRLTEKDSKLKEFFSSLLKEKAQDSWAITIDNLGLYDTVGSFIQLNDKVKYDLALEELPAKTIFHLAALHECRINFPLTTIFSKTQYASSFREDWVAVRSVNKANATLIEMYVPGAHADVGGGYLHGTEEGFRLRNQSIQLLSNYPMWSGLFPFYFKDQQTNWKQNLLFFRSTFMRAQKISGKLQYVYLYLMAEAANKSKKDSNKSPVFNLDKLRLIHNIVGSNPTPDGKIKLARHDLYRNLTDELNNENIVEDEIVFGIEEEQMEDHVLQKLDQILTKALNMLWDNPENQRVEQFQYQGVKQLLPDLWSHIHISANPITPKSVEVGTLMKGTLTGKTEEESIVTKRFNHSLGVNKPHNDWKRSILFA